MENGPLQNCDRANQSPFFYCPSVAYCLCQQFPSYHYQRAPDLPHHSDSQTRPCPSIPPQQKSHLYEQIFPVLLKAAYMMIALRSHPRLKQQVAACEKLQGCRSWFLTLVLLMRKSSEVVSFWKERKAGPAIGSKAESCIENRDWNCLWFFVLRKEKPRF